MNEVRVIHIWFVIKVRSRRTRCVALQCVAVRCVAVRCGAAVVLPCVVFTRFNHGKRALGYIFISVD